MNDPRRRLSSFCFVLGVLAGLLVFLAPSRAEAYPWMIRHGYTQCANCHADPAGGGLLNEYGRVQGEILMRTRYGSEPDHEPGPLAEPAFGLLELPKDLLIGADTRLAYIRSVPLQGKAQGRFLLMQADAEAQYSIGRFRANASLGYVSEGGNGAALSRSVDGKLVSRLHWVGVDLGKHDEVLVRAGRMHVPFGIRSIEHTRFVRRETRTDTNSSQQYGIEVDYHRGPIRAGVEGIAGNFLVSPDKFRSRGYSAYAEYAFFSTLAAGVSSSALNTQLDLTLLTKSWRHAHGLFARYSPLRPVVVTAELDYLHTSQPRPGKITSGAVGMLSADVEPIQGVHLGPTLEMAARDFGQSASYGLWGSAWWFFLPHADVRFDTIYNVFPTPDGAATKIVTAVLQIHAYL